MAGTSSQAGTQLDVHRCRFVDYVPASITAIAVPPTPLPRVRSQSAPSNSAHKGATRFPPIAVGRGDGNIELYEWSGVGETAQASSQSWVLHKILYAPVPSKVDNLIWVLRDPNSLRPGQTPILDDLRLFSAGGGSELLEWNLESGTIARTLSSQGGSIWSVSANASSTLLALGCDDGSIRIVSIADGVLEHKRKFDRVKTRLLSLAWGPSRPPTPRKPVTGAADSDDEDDEDDEWTDSWIIAGCADSTIRKWDFTSGRVLDRMVVDRQRGERTLVWAVAVLGDGTMVSGDSLGYVRFWDAQTCTQMQSYRLHGADVLCLAVGPEGRSIYSAGVDQKICQFSRVQVASGNTTSSRWIHSSSQRYHVHDVRALATWPMFIPLPPSVSLPPTTGRIISPLLFSGGLDISLNIKPCMVPLEHGDTVKVHNPLKTNPATSFENSWQARRTFHVRGLVHVARTARLLMLLRDKSVSVWRLTRLQNGTVEPDEIGLRTMLEDPDAEQGGWNKVLDMQLNVLTNLCCGAISDDGQWLAAADMYETKLFRLQHKGENIKPRRVKNLTSELLPHVASGSEDEVSTGATAMAFSPDSSKLVLGTSLSSYTLVIDLANAHDDLDNIRVLRRFEHHRMRDVILQPVSQAPRQLNGVHTDAVAMDVDEPSSSEMKSDAIAATSYEAHIRRISLITFSPDGQWLATSDIDRRVHVYNMDSIQHQCTLPSFESPVVALAFDPARTHHLVIVLATNRIRVFDVEVRTFPPSARAVCERAAPQLAKLRETVVGATFTRARHEPGTPAPGLVLWAYDWFCQIKLDAEAPAPVPSKRKKRGRDGDVADEVAPALSEDKELLALGTAAQQQGPKGKPLVINTQYRPLLFLGFMGDGDMVVVERPYVDILASLPPAYSKHKYGAS
ncbi:WD40 repeat-like protein [Auriculariales sp. MPI-PUGE-AT-0066]|nr:WD40 repeat-like protein [Auriculariales sp. MPI-PUGE-AT-0066]